MSLPGASTALGVVVGLAAVKLLVHLLTHRGYGYFRDELYYLACADHLDWGYVDHPPLIAAATLAVRRTLGDSLFALRLLPALAGALSVLVIGLIARRLGGGTFAQALACAAAIVAPVYLSVDHFLSMNAFEQLFWALGAWLVVRIVQEEGPRPWVLFGLVAGVGLLNKHSMLFFGFAVFAGLILTPHRRRLLTPWPWIAGGLALLIAFPNVLWEIRQGWPTLEFMENARRYKNTAFAPADFLVQQALLMNPVALPVWLAGLGWTLVSREGARHRILGWAYLVPLVVFVTQRGKPYYLAPAYPLLLAPGAVAIEAFVGRRRWGWAKPAALAVLAGSGLLLAPLALPILPPERFIRYAQALGIHPEAGERHGMGKLPQFYADMFGWPEMAAAVARIYATLSPEEKARTAIYAQNYGEAAAIDFFGRAHGLPKAVSGHNSYFLWGPGDRAIDTLIVIGGREEDHREVFEDVRLAGNFSHDYVMPYENDLPLYICRKPERPIRELWPRVRHYM